jgi:hypothetical protein
VALFARFDLSGIRGLVFLLFCAVTILLAGRLHKKARIWHKFSASEIMMSSQLGDENSLGSTMG